MISNSSKKSLVILVLRKKTTFEYFFCAALLGIATYTAWLLILSRTTQQSTLFFGGAQSGDTSMDFFNVLKYISTRDPYHYIEYNGLGEKAYPPLAYLLLYPFSRLYDYVNNYPFSARTTLFGIMSLLFFVGISFLAQSYILYKNKTGSSLIKVLFIMATISSGSYLFTVERANMILWTAPFLAVFIFWYKSDSPIKSEIAYIALACAFGLKIYPAFAGILLLKDKKWFAAIRTTIYGGLVFFLPFLFFNGGFSNFAQLLTNVSENSIIYQFLSPSYRFGFFSFALSTQIEASYYYLFTLLSYVLLLVALALTLVNKSYWKSVAMITCAIIATPTNSAYYCGIYIFVPVLLFLNEEKHHIFDWIYAFLFIIILNPFQIMIGGASFTVILANRALLILYILLICDSLFQFSRHKVFDLLKCRQENPEVPLILEANHLNSNANTKRA